jgi:hypothetical protein
VWEREKKRVPCFWLLDSRKKKNVSLVIAKQVLPKASERGRIMYHAIQGLPFPVGPRASEYVFVGGFMPHTSAVYTSLPTKPAGFHVPPPMT